MVQTVCPVKDGTNGKDGLPGKDGRDGKDGVSPDLTNYPVPML